MGTPSICTTYPTQRKAEVDGIAWRFASAKLGQMRGAGAEDLAAAAFSYIRQSVGAQGAGDLFTAEALRLKADRLAAFWTAKHTATATKRPHTQYSAEQAKRGREVSQYRRGRASDVLALRAQLAAQRGAEVSEIAAALGLTPQHARRLKRRRFALVLVLALARTFGNNPLPSPTRKAGTDHKETVPNVPLDGGGGIDRGQMRPDVVNIDEDRDRAAYLAALCGLLRGELGRVLLRGGP